MNTTGVLRYLFDRITTERAADDDHPDFRLEVYRSLIKATDADKIPGGNVTVTVMANNSRRPRPGGADIAELSADRGRRTPQTRLATARTTPLADPGTTASPYARTFDDCRFTI